MKIDLEAARYYAGLGDIVMLAWLAEGSKRTAHELVFHRKRDVALMSLLGLAVDPVPGGCTLDPAFDLEVADHGRRPRLDYIQEFLGVDIPLVRPQFVVEPSEEAWAERFAAQLARPPVLLFPQVAWKTREWPANYWVDLAWKLEAAGIPSITMLQTEDDRFKNTPKYCWNMSISRVAALVKRAVLVVGNDSFPAHLAGTIGTRTLVLLGPTRATVFAHTPDVECVSSDLDCSGCHFKTPFRAACDQGCMSLYRVFPDRIAGRILELIGGA